MIENLLINPQKNKPNLLTLKFESDAYKFHKRLNSYEPTELIDLRNQAKKTQTAAVFIKDESERFGLNSFKALGPYYAIYKLIVKRWNKLFNVPINLDLLNWEFIFERLGDYTFTAASEGNHGKSLAWAARNINQKCVIYLPSTISTQRLQAIKEMGAQIQIVSGSYEQTVRRCFQDGQEKKRTIISDMSYQDYRQIPIWIMEAYLTIFIEAQFQMRRSGFTQPDFVFVQAGVGGLAASAAYFYGQEKFKGTKVICVEPETSDCIMESARRGKYAKTRASMNTIMGCLNCDYPSYVALPTILQHTEAFLTISDDDTKQAMRTLYHPIDSDQLIISGESGAASFAGFQKVINSPFYKKALGINANSVILCINTEGNNDPESFEEIVNHNG